MAEGWRRRRGLWESGERSMRGWGNQLPTSCQTDIVVSKSIPKYDKVFFNESLPMRLRCYKFCDGVSKG